MCELKTGIKGQVEYFNFQPSALDDLYLDGILSTVTSSKEALTFFHKIILEAATELTEASGIPNWDEIKDTASYWKSFKGIILDKHRNWLRDHDQLK